MSSYIKNHIYSSAITFVSIFLMTLSTSVSGLSLGSISTSVIVALLAAAVRTAGKVVIEGLVPPEKFGISR